MATTAEATRTGGRSRPALRGPALAEWGAYACAVVLVCWPGILHARTQIFGAGDDARYYRWLGWRIGRSIALTRPFPLRIGDVIEPFGLDLRLLDGYLPTYASGLFNRVTGPTLAYNLAFVTGAVLNVLAARALGRRLSARRLVRTLTAVAFVTAPALALNVQQGLLPLFWAFTLPLLVADAIDVVTGVREVRVVRLALLLGVAYLCSVYFLVFGGIAYGVIVAVAAIRRRSGRTVLATAGAVALTLVLLLPFVVPRVRFDTAEAGRGGDAALVADSNVFSADALSVLAQPTRSTFLLPRPQRVERAMVRLPDRRSALETTAFPGLLLLAGFAAFCFVRDVRRFPLVAAAAVTWVLGLGPSLKLGGDFVWTNADGPVPWLAYRALLAAPGLGGLRVPIRSSEVLLTIFAAATAIALDRLCASARLSAAAIGAGAAVLLATNLLVPLPTTSALTTDASEHALREISRLAEPGDTVLRVPTDCEPSFASLQVVHHAPVVGCTGSFAANPWSDLAAYTESGAFTKLRCDKAGYGRLRTDARPPTATFGPADVQELRERFGVRFVVLDRSLLPGCAAAEAALPVLEHYPSLGGDDRFSVFDLQPRRLSAP